MNKAWLSRFVLVVVCLSAWILGGSVASAVPADQRNQQAAGLVADALRHEFAGADGQRQQLLQSALEQSPEFAPARWHSGYVRLRNQWVKVDEMPSRAAGDERLAAYRRVRSGYPETAEGQLALAAWCAKHKLVDQQRAHLTKVLEINPDHAEARRLLGFRLVGGRWISAEETAQAEARARQSDVAVRQWRPALEEIRRGLARGKGRAYEIACQRLRAIDDPDAVEAIELVLANDSESTALLAVETLEGIRGPAAALVLARQAIFSPWPAVRQAAAAKLKSKDVQSYVPQLLASMSTAVQSVAQLYTAPNGRLTYRHTFVRGRQDQNEVLVLETEYRNNVLSGDVAGARAALQQARLGDASSKAVARELAVRQQNAAIEQFNQQLCDVLSTSTGQVVSPTPDAWWQWWNDYNEVYLADSKLTAGLYLRETVAFSNPYTPTGSGSGSGGSTPSYRPRYECLVAGTPVWTETGPVPIEKIKLGDRVLAQDSETGQLAYKPVLRTTTRPSTQLMKIVAGSETITCSGGHPFWVAGDGWVKARLLKPDSYLHTVTGTLKVVAVEEAGIEPTYNLIVADLHTYFVGSGRILTHDNTVRRPTSTLVPGLRDQ